MYLIKWIPYLLLMVQLRVKLRSSSALLAFNPPSDDYLPVDTIKYAVSVPYEDETPDRVSLDSHGLYMYDYDYGKHDLDPDGEVFDKADVRRHADYEYEHMYADYTTDTDSLCTNDAFFCPRLYGSYGRCLRKDENGKHTKICDGKADCLNGADEVRCADMRKLKPVLFEGQPARDNFSCGGKFVPASWRCDGYCDCSQITSDQCKDETSTCPDSRPAKLGCPLKKCNGHIDCLNHEDELDCPKISQTSAEEKRSKKWYYKKCDDYNKTKTIYYHDIYASIRQHGSFQCDGHPDCLDGSDEKNCESSSEGSYPDQDQKCREFHNGILIRNKHIYIGAYIPTAKKIPGALFCLKTQACQSKNVANMEYYSTKGFKPLSSHPTCQPKMDDLDGTCPSDRFHCKKDGKDLCLDYNKICNGIQDCDNTTSISHYVTSFFSSKKVFDDENSTLCDALKGLDIGSNRCKCKESLEKNCKTLKAIELTKNFSCNKCFCVQCEEGFERNATTGKCQDINECQAEIFNSPQHACSHGCYNTEGGFHCHCPAGLVLSLDGKNCRPIDAEKWPVKLDMVTRDAKLVELTLAMSGPNMEWNVQKEEVLYAMPDSSGMLSTVIVDEKNKIIYFGSFGTPDNPPSIYRYNITTQKTDTFYTFKSGTLHNIAFDYITGNLHAVLNNFDQQPCHAKKSYKTSSVHVIFPTFSARMSKVPFIRVHGGLNKPRGLVVIPEEGYTYILDWYSEKKLSYLYKISFDSFQNVTFTVKRIGLKLKYANVLIYDRFNYRILIVDADHEKLVTCDIHAFECSDEQSHNTHHTYHALLLGRTLLLSEMKRPEIVAMDLYDPTRTRSLYRPKSIVYGMTYRNFEIQERSSFVFNNDACIKKKCPYMCIHHSLLKLTNITGTSKEAGGVGGTQCMCPNGVVTNSSRPCTGVGQQASSILAITLRATGRGYKTRNKDDIEFQALATDLTTGTSDLLNIHEDMSAFAVTSHENTQPVYDTHKRQIIVYHPDTYTLYKYKLPEYDCDPGADTFQNLLLQNIELKTTTLSKTSYVDKEKFIEKSVKHPQYVPELDILCGLSIQWNKEESLDEEIIVCYKKKNYLAEKKGVVIFRRSTKSALNSNPILDFCVDKNGFAVLTHKIENMLHTTISFYSWSGFSNGPMVTYTIELNSRDHGIPEIMESKLWYLNSKKFEFVVSAGSEVRFYKQKLASKWAISYDIHKYTIPARNGTKVKITQVQINRDRLYGIYQVREMVSSKIRFTDVIFNCKFDMTQTDIDGKPCEPFIRLPPYSTAYSGDQSNHILAIFINRTEPTTKPITSEWSCRKCSTLCAYVNDTLACICDVGYYFDKSRSGCFKIQSCDFVCPSGKCIEAHNFCDGVNDCGRNDSFDEDNCHVGCPDNTFVCDVGTKTTSTVKNVCIPWEKVCDNPDKPDCPNKRDETECLGNTPTRNDCPEFLCKRDLDKTKKAFCLPYFKIGNGIIECTDTNSYNNDESYKALKYKCRYYGDFHCSRTGVCLSNTSRCDGVYDCGSYPPFNPYGLTSTDKSLKTLSKVDKSDERFCSTVIKQCSTRTHFFCTSSHQCISNTMVCDGIHNCPEGEDEKDCNATEIFIRNDYRHDSPCPNKRSCLSINKSGPICLTSHQICDGTKDCLDGQDEGGDCKTACEFKNHGDKKTCGKCFRTPHGPLCSCTTHIPQFEFIKSTSPGTCKTPNYCNALGTCDQICKQTQGTISPKTGATYECSCKPGWSLDSNNHTCDYAFTHSINLIELDDHGEIFAANYPTKLSKSTNRTYNVNPNSYHRKITGLQHGHYDNRPKMMTLNYNDQLCVVETDIDGYDSIYCKYVESDLLWYSSRKLADDIKSKSEHTIDTRITLPNIKITAMANGPENAYRRFDKSVNFIIAAKTSWIKNFGIYFLSSFGHGGLLVEAEKIITSIAYLENNKGIYYSQTNQLFKFDFNTKNVTKVSSFPGSRITSLAVDHAFDKLWIVTDRSRVFFIDYEGNITPMEIFLHPQLETINCLTVTSTYLVIGDEESRFLWAFNKFSGYEVEQRRKIRISRALSGVSATRNIMQVIDKTLRDETVYLKKIKSYKELTTQCPPGTYDVRQILGEKPLDLCMCLSWENKVKFINRSITIDREYYKNPPCGKPKCNSEAFIRFAKLRNAYVWNIENLKNTSLIDQYTDPMSSRMAASAQCIYPFKVWQNVVVKDSRYYKNVYHGQSSGLTQVKQDHSYGIKETGLVHFSYRCGYPLEDVINAHEYPPEIYIEADDKKMHQSTHDWEYIHYWNNLECRGAKGEIDIFYDKLEGDNGCIKDCSPYTCKSQLKLKFDNGSYFSNNSYWCSCPSLKYGKGCKYTRSVQKIIEDITGLSAGKFILIVFLVLLSLFSCCWCMLMLYKETKNRGFHTGFSSPYKFNGLYNYKDLHNEHANLQTAFEEKESLEKVSFERAIPESSMGFNFDVDPVDKQTEIPGYENISVDQKNVKEDKKMLLDDDDDKQPFFNL